MSFLNLEGIIFGLKVSMNGVEADKAKVEVIEKSPPLFLSKG